MGHPMKDRRTRYSFVVWLMAASGVIPMTRLTRLVADERDVRQIRFGREPKRAMWSIRYEPPKADHEIRNVPRPANGGFMTAP